MARHRLSNAQWDLIADVFPEAESNQLTSVMHLNGVLPHVFPEALGSRYVLFTTDRLHRHPERQVIQPMTDFEKVMGMLEVVRPATNDWRVPCKPGHEAFLQRSIANRLAQSQLYVGERLSAYPNFRDQLPGFPHPD